MQTYAAINVKITSANRGVSSIHSLPLSLQGGGGSSADLLSEIPERDKGERGGDG